MASDESENILRPFGVAIIREVYDSENAHLKFDLELERALIAGVCIIVIEPEPLGEETARWILVGNVLHRIAVYSGFCSLAAGLIWKPYLSAPFCIVSVLCSGCYTLSWQFDPCCKYQVETNRNHLESMPILNELTSTTPVVLVRKDNTKKIMLHCSISIASLALCFWQFYKVLK